MNSKLIVCMVVGLCCARMPAQEFVNLQETAPGSGLLLDKRDSAYGGTGFGNGMTWLLNARQATGRV